MADQQMGMGGGMQGGGMAQKWDPKGNVSWLWALVGAIPFVGMIIAIIYVLLSDSKKKLFSLLYIIGWIGALVVWLVVKDEDHRLSDLSFKLLIGNLVIGGVILVLAIALGALFSLGAFGGGSGGQAYGTSCIAGPGYLCTQPLLTSTGWLSFTFGQSTGTTIYNVQMACMPIEAQPTASEYTQLGATPITSGQTVVTATRCYNADGTPFSGAVGMPYTGSIWLEYTAQNAAVSASNPLFSAKIATLSVKVT